MGKNDDKTPSWVDTLLNLDNIYSFPHHLIIIYYYFVSFDGSCPYRKSLREVYRE